MAYTMTTGDRNVVGNLRYQYGEALIIFSDEDIARAWWQYSLSDEYNKRHDEPNLFLEWVEMAHSGLLT